MELCEHAGFFMHTAVSIHALDDGGSKHLHPVDHLPVRAPRRRQRLPLQHEAQLFRGRRGLRQQQQEQQPFHPALDTAGSFSSVVPTFTTGSEKENVVPERSLLSTQIEPPWRSTICLVI